MCKRHQAQWHKEMKRSVNTCRCPQTDPKDKAQIDQNPFESQ